MRKKIIYKLVYYSYYIVYGLFILYLPIYAVFLRSLSIYYTYLMIFIGGLFLGYFFSDEVHRYLRRSLENKEKSDNQNNK